MEEALARVLIKDHFERSNISVASGGSIDDIAGASEIYADDARLARPMG